MERQLSIFDLLLRVTAGAWVSPGTQVHTAQPYLGGFAFVIIKRTAFVAF